MTLTTFVSTVAYRDFDSCQRMVRLLRDVFEPHTSLTADFDVQTKTWRIRYTLRPEASHG